MKQITHFTPKELNRWYRGFLKDCPSGTLSKEEFCHIYRNFFPFGNPTKFAGYLFNMFDTNNDGTIDFKEFITALSVTSQGTMEEKLHWSFQLFDHNHDGYITRDEVLEVTDSLYKMVGHMIQLPEDENSPQERINKLFEVLDTDRDGKINLEEFVEGAKNDPTIVQGLMLYEDLIH